MPIAETPFGPRAVRACVRAGLWTMASAALANLFAPIWVFFNSGNDSYTTIIAWSVALVTALSGLGAWLVTMESGWPDRSGRTAGIRAATRIVTVLSAAVAAVAILGILESEPEPALLVLWALLLPASFLTTALFVSSELKGLGQPTHAARAAAIASAVVWSFPLFPLLPPVFLAVAGALFVYAFCMVAVAGQLTPGPGPSNAGDSGASL